MMDNIDWLNVIARIAHVFAAIMAVGGAVFACCVMIPAGQALPEDQRRLLHEKARGHFARIVMISIALLLVSGFFNFIRNELPAHKGQGLYHGLIGVKIILAFAVFFIASALTGRSRAFEKMRRNRVKWLGLNITLGFVIVCISAVLRAIPEVP